MGMFDLGIGGLFKGLKSFMSPEKGYQKGQEQLDKYYQQSQGYLQPYNQQGQQAYGHLNTAMQNLLNPAQLNDQFANNYQTSNLARMQQERAMNQGNRAASSMGLMGSSPALQALQAGANEIGAQDEQRYMDRMIQQYLQGAGLAQNVYGMGAQAGGQMGQNAMHMGDNSAQMAFGQQNAPGQMFGNLLNTAISAAVPMYGMAKYGSNALGGMMGGASGQSPGWSTRG